MKNIKNSFYFLTFVSSLTATPLVQAQIPMIAFKNVTKVFRKGKEYNSPTLGKAALETGLMHDMRFYGNFSSGHNDKGRREFVRDSSKDPQWRVLKDLLPSPAGDLTPTVNSALNLGKFATPQTVAVMLNFANKVRESQILIELNKELKLLNKEKQFLTKPESSQKMGKQFKPRYNREQTETRIKSVSESIKKTQKELEDFTKEAITKLMKSFNKQDTDWYEKMEEQVATPLIKNIRSSIEEENKSLAPKYSIEQEITAFFCQLFNNRGDIKALLQNLDGSIVDSALVKTFDEDDIVTQEYIKHVAKTETDQLGFDEIYMISNEDTLTSTTPYKPGDQPLGNSQAQPYDRKSNTLLADSFAECVEMGMRHVMNLILFNHEQRVFDLSHIRKFIKPENPYFQHFEEFFAAQTPDKANDGSNFMRSLWNKVIADLNTAHEKIRIHYLRNDNNEINPGFINFVRVFQKVFDLNLQDLPDESDFKGRIDWLTASLATLFKTLNPTHSYLFDTSDLKPDQGDISGSLRITVQDEKGDRTLFAFDLSSEVNRHSAVKIVTRDDIQREIPIQKTTITPGTAEESLLLLFPKGKIPDHPLYKFFHKRIEDNESRLNLLNTINAEYDDWMKSPHKHDILAILGHVMENTSWDDRNIVEHVSPIILNLMAKRDPDTLQVLGAEIKSLRCSAKNMNAAEIIRNFKKLAFLELSQANFPENFEESHRNLKELKIEGSKLNIISLHKYPILQTLKIQNCSLRTLKGLEFLPGLKTLSLTGTNYPLELNLERNGKLENLDISNSKVNMIKGMENLIHLKTLNLSNAPLLKVPPLEKLVNLEALDLDGQKLDSLNLSSFTKLKLLSLAGAQNMSELSFKGLGSLEVLRLGKTSLTRLKDLENADNLRYLDLSESQIEELFLHNVPSLLSLSLSKSAIKSIELDGLRSLDYISLDETKNLERLSIKNADKLDYFNCPKKLLKSVHLENLPRLTLLDLSKPKTIGKVSDMDSVIIRNCPGLYKLDLKHCRASSIQLENLNMIEILNFDVGRNFKRLKLAGSFKSLKKIYFNPDQKVEIDGLEELIAAKHSSGEDLEIIGRPLSGLSHEEKEEY
jgi:hypothetical protein